jgi:phage protein U
LTDEEKITAEKNNKYEAQTNSEGYIYPTEQAAIEAGNKVSLPEGAKDKNVTAEPKKVDVYKYGRWTLAYTYTATRWRYKITYKLDGETVYYYKYQSGGQWNYSNPVESDEQTFYQTVGPTTDELRIYSGNTFTISVPDNYEITKVKVYYSGDNKVWELGGFMGIGKDKLYARFVETSIQVPGSQSSPIQLDGMEYQDNFSSGITTSGWQQWTGKGKQSVTFKLMDYYDEAVGASAHRYSYRDVVTTGERPSNLDKYLVVDKIEVKVVQKTSTQTE